MYVCMYVCMYICHIASKTRYSKNEIYIFYNIKTQKPQSKYKKKNTILLVFLGAGSSSAHVAGLNPACLAICTVHSPRCLFFSRFPTLFLSPCFARLSLFSLLSVPVKTFIVERMSPCSLCFFSSFFLLVFCLSLVFFSLLFVFLFPCSSFLLFSPLVRSLEGLIYSIYAAPIRKQNLGTQSRVACNRIKQIRKRNILIDSVILVIILHV